MSVSDVLQAANLMVGWDSMLLIEGHLSGIPVVSLGKGSVEYRHAIPRSLGIDRLACDGSALAAWLSSARGWTPPRRKFENTPGVARDSAQRSLAFIGKALDSVTP